jgi:hypothetical protein
MINLRLINSLIPTRWWTFKVLKSIVGRERLLESGVCREAVRKRRTQLFELRIINNKCRKRKPSQLRGPTCGDMMRRGRFCVRFQERIVRKLFPTLKSTSKKSTRNSLYLQSEGCPMKPRTDPEEGGSTE